MLTGNSAEISYLAPVADWRRVVVVEDLDGDLAAGDEDAVGDRDLEAVRGDELPVQRPAHVQLAVLFDLMEIYYFSKFYYPNLCTLISQKYTPRVTGPKVT